MKRVVSVSLGSSERDSSAQVELLGQEFEISRVGTDGDKAKFAQMVSELDGKVDAIGLGGTDRYLWTGKRRYTVRDADRLARCAKSTPVVDGSGVKHTLERKTIEYLQANGIVDFASSKVLITSAVDRFGMAQTIAGLSKDVVYGDLMFACNVPIPIRSYSMINMVGGIFLPLVCRLPFEWIYPTGSKQKQSVPKYVKYYAWADVIAGDFHFIKRTMPALESGALEGKVIITNTLTADDVMALAQRKARLLVTATPDYNGRRFGTNVLEGVLVTLLGKDPDELTSQDYDELLARLDWKPTITDLATHPAAKQQPTKAEEAK